MSEDRIDELIALAALGELTEAEAGELDAALAADSTVAEELDADLATAAALQKMHREAPSPQLKLNVLAAIDGVAQEANDVQAGRDTTRAHSPTVTSPAVTSPNVMPIGRARSARRLSRWQPFLAAAAVIALVVGGVVIAARDSGGPSPFDAVAEAPDAQTRTLSGTLAGTLEVVYSADADAFVLDGTGIPVLTADESYQLWLVDDSGAQPVGLFRPDESGRVEQRFDDLDPTDYVVGVTIEPAAGSDTPTLPIIASA